MSDEQLHTAPPVRWRDGAAGADGIERRASALIRGALVPGDPGDSWIGPVRQRLRQRHRRWAFSSRIFRLTLAGLVFLTAASVAAYQAARHAGWLPGSQPETMRPPSVEHGSPSRSSMVSRPTSTALRVDSLEQPEAEREERRPFGMEPTKPDDKREPVSRLSLRRAPRRVVPSHREEQAPAPAAPATSDEIRTLEHAIGLLRKDRDAGEALIELERYLDRYPSGVLAREARVARVDALLLLQRSDEALVALETLPLDVHGRSTELQLVRGELRARSSCSRAEEDFSVVLARGSDETILERALHDRALCRAKRGDADAATSDVESYLDRFPTGPHATWAHRWLDSTERP